MGNYFYHFLEDTTPELARIAKELEGAIYSSPRSMLTHSRTFVEAILEKVMIKYRMDNEPYLTIIERIEDLDQRGLLNDEVKRSLNHVRKYGNMAAHSVRQFRYSESLNVWEHIYQIVKWYIEIFDDLDIKLPPYVDPEMNKSNSYNLEELNIRFKTIEELLKKSLKHEEELNLENKKGKVLPLDQSKFVDKRMDYEPGFTPIRTIYYGKEEIEIPYFLRDAFILPQRFVHSEKFLLRLGQRQNARIISELPEDLIGIHKRVKRFSEKHSKMFFDELKLFVKEEIRRKKLTKDRPGELFLFYNSEEIIVTEEFEKVKISTDNFVGFPNFIKQMNKDGIYTVNDLPKEIVILGKYDGVGVVTVGQFFEQLKEIQNAIVKKGQEQMAN